MNHTNHVTRTTSANAYHAMERNGRLFETTQMILDALNNCPDGMTRREIEQATGLRINQVAGRVNEMLKRGILKEGERRKCSITGNVVNVVKVAR